jgi:hypothetical protein
VWKWVTPNGPIACGHCGYTMDEWDWMKEEEKQHANDKETDRQL